MESRIAERVHAVELRARAEAARVELECANCRATELEAANTELRAALEREQELKVALMCLLETEGAMALEVAQRLLASIGGEPFPTSRGPLRVTASLGLADLRQRDDSVERLTARADAALYVAKRRGRNRVERELEELVERELEVAE